MRATHTHSTATRIVIVRINYSLSHIWAHPFDNIKIWIERIIIVLRWLLAGVAVSQSRPSNPYIYGELAKKKK